MDVKGEIRAQIVGALAGARFPINIPEDLLSAFPMGASTTCQAGNIKMTAGDAGKLLTPAYFPFLNSDQVADTILKRAGL